MPEAGASEQNEGAKEVHTPGDGWLEVKPFLVPFRPEGCNPTEIEQNEKDIEANRIKYCEALLSKITKEGYTLHPNVTPGLENIFAVETPYEAKRIVIPKHIVTTDPTEDIRNRRMNIREDIPVLYILAGFAHEREHVERYIKDPEAAKVLDKSAEDKFVNLTNVEVKVEPDGKVSPPAANEEVEADVGAFFTLKDIGVDLLPESFCTYVGRGPFYQRIIYDKINARLQQK